VSSWYTRPSTWVLCVYSHSREIERWCKDLGKRTNERRVPKKETNFAAQLNSL
jgi:hypothetical protein